MTSTRCAAGAASGSPKNSAMLSGTKGRITGVVTGDTEDASAIGQDTCTVAVGSVPGQPGQQSKSDVSTDAVSAPLENVLVLASLP